MAIEGSRNETRNSRIQLGMVGGGAGAFIGGVHRIAARLDDRFDLVAGALSSTQEKSIASGRELGLDPSRTYGSYKEMAIREARLKDGIERSRSSRLTICITMQPRNSCGAAYMSSATSR